MSQAEIKVRIWIAAAGADAVPLLPALLARLDEEARARVLRMRREADRALHAVAQVLLRAALAAEGVPAPRFRLGPHGKPELEGGGAAPPPRFNLSHTDGLAACAVAHGHEVGLDVEALDRRLDVWGLSAKVLTEAEQVAIRQAPAPAGAFLDIWTVKEAVAKAAGLGLHLPFRSLRVTFDPLRLHVAPELGWAEAEWHVEQHRPTPRHRLSLALRRPPGCVVATELRVARLAELAAG